MGADEEEGNDKKLQAMAEMNPTLDAIPVDLEAIRSRYPSVKVGITIDGKYRVEKEIGRGGMGSVYRAIQLSMNRPVAIKTLKTEMLADDVPVKRFFREAKSASQLNHPNIVRVFDFGVDETLGVPYLVMELLEGKTLTQMVEDGPLDERHAARLMAQIAKALVDAHSHAMVHRDLKPDNILVVRLPDGDEHVKVLDFGLAKVWETDGSESMVTQSGHIAGTPAFMSPEQIVGEAVDFRADLYALGCVLFYILVGRPVFGGDEALSVVIKQVNEPAPSLHEAMSDLELPTRDICAIFERLMAKDPTERPMTTTSVARYFSAIARGDIPNIEQLNVPGSKISTDFPSQPLSSQAVQTGVRSRPSGVHTARKEKRDLVYLAMGPLFMIGLGIILAQGLMNEEPEEDPQSLVSKTSVADEEQSRAQPITVESASNVATEAPPESGGALSTEEAAALIGALAGGDNKSDSPSVNVQTIPRGAKLFRGDKHLGATPMRIPQDSDNNAWTLTIKHPGYQPSKHQINHDTPASLIIRLEPVSGQ